MADFINKVLAVLLAMVLLIIAPLETVLLYLMIYCLPLLVGAVKEVPART